MPTALRGLGTDSDESRSVRVAALSSKHPLCTCSVLREARGVASEASGSGAAVEPQQREAVVSQRVPQSRPEPPHHLPPA